MKDKYIELRFTEIDYLFAVCITTLMIIVGVTTINNVKETQHLVFQETGINVSWSMAVSKSAPEIALLLKWGEVD